MTQEELHVLGEVCDEENCQFCCGESGHTLNNVQCCTKCYYISDEE